MTRIISFSFPRLALLVLPLFAACTAERRDALWRKLDPAGYKHAHSASFRGPSYKRMPEGAPDSTKDEMGMEITR